jgi:hypothetical protein
MGAANPPPPPADDTVAADELLYRRVYEEQVGRDTENKPFLHKSAFNDRYLQPSVDRAHINHFDPQRTRLRDDMSNAVASLVAHRVRAIATVIDHYAETPGTPHRFDVIPDPVHGHPTEPDNPAHAKIQSARPMQGNAFDHLKRALVKISTIDVLPHEPVVYLTTTRRVYHVRTCRHVQRGRTAVAFTTLPAGARPCCGCQPAMWTPDAVPDPPDRT